ncbi:MAG: hypothetical protein Q9M21_02700 [Mariprofundaceae bacterium]|nr:hypothetical protein [Mariprofundaceae bacterium]
MAQNDANDVLSVSDKVSHEVLDEMADADVKKTPRSQPAWVKRWISGEHSRREWLLLGERVFSHPRYAILIVVALVLCMFERYSFVLATLGVFFVVEWCLRFWLQKENHFRNRGELVFLILDGLATISLISALFMPVNPLQQAVYLRVARLFRGMYMLRMLRIFRFLTHDTFVYSLPFALVVVALACVAIAVPSVAMYIGVFLLIEGVCRTVSILKVLPNGGRKKAELAFVSLDMLASIAVLGLIPGVAVAWVGLRAIRFLVMLNPVGNIAKAAKRVLAIQEVRNESSMLAGMLVAMMIMGSLAVLYLYPEMDINDDGNITSADYLPFQVMLYVFRVLTDPGAATPEAFSPWLVGLTSVLVLSGVFFFALMVSLGSNVMQYMLRELSNSPLSAREQMVLAGWNDQSLAILKRLDKLFARMRQSMSSVWIFHGQALSGASSVGSWLSVREVASGSRDLMARFHLKGIRQLVLFRKGSETLDTENLVDTHHLVRDLKVDGMMISEAELSTRLQSIYSDSMSMSVLNSASVTARMLYQMHHCAWMPELGIRMLDAVAGEIGLNTMAWEFEVQASSGMVMVSAGQEKQVLDAWLTDCFVSGVNLLAARREDGSFVLFSDLMRAKKNEIFTDVVGLGGSTLLWSGIMESALSMDANQPHQNLLKQFTWPETWDLSMIFLGWHAGLPAMIEEMALKHHKLTVHVLSTMHEDKLTLQNRSIKDACERASAHCQCELKVSLHAWDGLDTEVWESLLRGCKVMMFYPEEQSNGSEDSLLELWFHEVAHVLSERKAKVKWWTPPKLMILPRSGEHVSSFEIAGLNYPDLAVDVGSPDAFHDVFMARQLLTHARKHLNQEESQQDEKSYAFMDAMLGDAVLVEDVATTRLVEIESGMDWVPVYREALRRGWMLMAYVMPEIEHDGQTAFTVLNKLFPQPQDDTGSRMHLLAGSPVMEMDVPAQTVTLLFCRRGVLSANETEEGDVEVAIEIPVQEVVVEKVVADVKGVGEEASEATPESIQQDIIEENVEEVVEKEISKQVESKIDNKGVGIIKQAETGLEKAVLEGEVMNDSVWPQQADKRLLRVLKKQVGGSLELLNESCEEGLVKLTEILDMGVSEEVEELIMAALTDLQNIDRVSQRLNNVKSCLKDWSNHVPESGQTALWQEEVSQRYVMEEERMVLKEEL